MARRSLPLFADADDARGIGGLPTWRAQRNGGSADVVAGGWLAPDALLARVATTLTR
jgi:hypothetical protein